VEAQMTKTELLAIITRLLEADEDLSFLLQLDEKDLILLTAYIRERVEWANMERERSMESFMVA
jgi:hypothetical protein